ncbi:uncharacterized protein L203_101956 [Cryptococcus depauperatus CBS 7841]|uniref:Uncharacterized protein n=1 Tax=Cryptococcus depauperatus CBS 7841 TaxID=1295531 RepID=A0A1E3IJW9_9TREE|nr:hypothetical protein L203_03206 [Cryptococcus depauperatus CBS 7841]
MHNNPEYPSDKSLSNIFDPVRSPSLDLPVEPAPAYTALPNRDVDFFLAPLLGGKLGDIELETVDGKRFLVHRKVLEHETVFFHIYYGFVPAWRLNRGSSLPRTEAAHLPPNCHRPAAPREHDTSALSNFLCLPKLIASHLSRSPAAASLIASHQFQTTAAPDSQTHSHAAANVNGVSSPDSLPPPFEDLPPPLPPKDITAPTPTLSPYTWAVPESSLVLTAFLSLIYPPGVISSTPTSFLKSLELTGRVTRAALGYQSAKALSIARDHMVTWIDEQPVQVYAMASFFKFGDLARLASMKAMKAQPSQWPEDAKVLMGRSAAKRLVNLRNSRLIALKDILAKPMEEDEHAHTCVRYPMAKDLWTKMTNELSGIVGAESELIELLNVDLRGGHCGECLVLLGRSVQRCLYEAKELPQMI